MKKMSIVLLTVGLCLLNVVSTSNATWNWEGFRAHNNLVSFEAPRGVNETVLDWDTGIADTSVQWDPDTMTNPIIVDGYIYIASATNTKLLKLDMDGNIVASTDMDGSVGFNAYITYGDGKIFVCQSETTYDENWNVVDSSAKVQAFDMATMKSVWQSEELGTLGLDETIEAPIVYHDQYVYVGTTNGFGTAGTYIALSTVDEEPEETNEVKHIAWQYEPTSPSGYRWSGGCIVGNAIVFVSNTGELTSCSLKDGTVLSTRQIQHPVTTSITYDNGYLYLGTKDGYLVEIKYNDNYTFGGQNITTLMPGGSITGAVTVYEGKIYLGGAKDNTDFYSKGFVMVVNTGTYAIEFESEVEANVQSSMLVNTYYDDTYAYFTKNDGVGGVYSIKVSDKEITLQDVFIPEEELQQYCNSSVITDGKRFYYTNDTGHLIAFSKVLYTDLIEPDKPIKEEPNKQPIGSKTDNVKTGDFVNIWSPIMSLGISIYVLKKPRK